MEKLIRIHSKQNGYFIVKAPIGYPGSRIAGLYAYEHRVIWWLQYGELPPNGFHIHHINGDPCDNRIENLEAITVTEHVKKSGHLADVYPEAHSVLTCHQCKKEFQQLERSVRWREKQGQNQFFCSKSCQVTFQNQFKKGKSNNYPKTRKQPALKGVNLICQSCQKEYYVTKHREHISKTCSKQCSNVFKSCTMK